MDDFSHTQSYYFILKSYHDLIPEFFGYPFYPPGSDVLKHLNKQIVRANCFKSHHYSPGSNDHKHRIKCKYVIMAVLNSGIYFALPIMGTKNNNHKQEI